MKIALLFVCIAFAGCGAKSNEEKAKDLIVASLKSTLPDFNSYEPVSYGNLGNASLSYEETDQYIAAFKKLHGYEDSMAIVEKIIKENNGGGDTTYKNKLQPLQDSIRAISARKSEAKQAYTPEKLFKLKHAYKFKNKDGVEMSSEDEFYFDKDVTRIVKMNHLK